MNEENESKDKNECFLTVLVNIGMTEYIGKCFEFFIAQMTGCRVLVTLSNVSK